MTTCTPYPVALVADPAAEAAARSALAAIAPSATLTWNERRADSAAGVRFLLSLLRARTTGGQMHYITRIGALGSVALGALALGCTVGEGAPPESATGNFADATVTTTRVSKDIWRTELVAGGELAAEMTFDEALGWGDATFVGDDATVRVSGAVALSDANHTLHRLWREHTQPTDVQYDYTEGPYRCRSGLVRRKEDCNIDFCYQGENGGPCQRAADDCSARRGTTTIKPIYDTPYSLCYCDYTCTEPTPEDPGPCDGCGDCGCCNGDECCD